MQALSSVKKNISYYIYNDCTAFVLVSINVIYSIFVGLYLMTQGGLLKKISWEDTFFRNIVYWGLSEVLITATIRLIYTCKARNTALKVAFITAAFLPGMPMFTALAGNVMIKRRDSNLTLFFISLAIFSIAINGIVSAVVSSAVVKQRPRSSQELIEF